MDLFARLPPKYKTTVCCVFFVLMVVLIASFAIALIFGTGWKSAAYLAAVVILSGILAWTLKGGTMEGNINPKGMHVKLCDGPRKEDEELPDTYVTISTEHKE